MKYPALLIIAGAVAALSGCKNVDSAVPGDSPEKVTETAADTTAELTAPENIQKEELTTMEVTSPATESLSPAESIGLCDTDGSGSTYTFTWDGEEFTALYWTDNWRVIDSYRIQDIESITLVCQALADTHPIHSADYSGWRTADDMAYEWVQHNIAYDFLPAGSSLSSSAKDVDLDPKDQGKSVYDMFLDRFVTD